MSVRRTGGWGDLAIKPSPRLYKNLDPKWETYKPPTVRDDPRLERDATRNPLPNDVARGNSWAALSKRRQR